ncbi:MAG TPA: hypothetical protein VD963_06770 [Phycisphaerales bacterium]|nr:hypothetical protein [Phycisphaerales bacterium]
MADYSWFRLLVKTVGLLLVALGLPQTIAMLGWLISLSYAQNAPMLGGRSWLFTSQLFTITGYLAQLAFGLYLFFGGGAVVRRCLRDVYGRCPACDYDVRGVTAPTCPECGIALPGRPPRAASSPAGGSTPPPPAIRATLVAPAEPGA